MATDQDHVGEAGGPLLETVNRGAVEALEERAAGGEELVGKVAVEDGLGGGGEEAQEQQGHRDLVDKEDANVARRQQHGQGQVQHAHIGADHMQLAEDCSWEPEQGKERERERGGGDA